MYKTKDFIETHQGLFFAVVTEGLEHGIIRCYLRYIRVGDRLQKLNTEEANLYLSKCNPNYLFFSLQLDAKLHGVPVGDVLHHYQPTECLQALLNKVSQDPVILDLQDLCSALCKVEFPITELGITGSCCINAHHLSSDLDLVTYDNGVFNQLRKALKTLCELGYLSRPTTAQWLESYERRQTHTINFDEYVWHERRKWNKAIINHRKVDISLVQSEPFTQTHYKKKGFYESEFQVIDATKAFHYPATFTVDHTLVSTIVSYTATFTGQAESGEWVRAAGELELSTDGSTRLVIGSTREAIGEYLKVILF